MSLAVTGTRPAVLLWVAVFIYTAIVALAVQLVILPYVFPRWHAGNGLLVGGDWLEYHRLAVELASRIQEEGWSAWQLRPAGHAAAGIAALVYGLTTPQPWTLIPLNAALHATAAVVLFRLVRVLVQDRKAALLVVIPFVVYPSAMTWYAQVLKDGYAVLGYLMFVYGWALMVQGSTWETGFGPPARAVAWIGGGTALNWLVRPHILEIVQAVGAGLALLATGLAVARSARGKLSWRRALAATVVAWVSVAIVSAWQPSRPQEVLVQRRPEAEGALSLGFARRVTNLLDQKARAVGLVRAGYVLQYPTAASNFDTEVTIGSSADVIHYIPRATVVAFLAPFPRHWLATGSAEPNTFARRLAGIEMVGVYLALPWLAYAIYRWRARPELYAILLFCAGMMIAYAVMVPNLGALHRLRYAFLMTFVAVGLAAAITRLQEGRVARVGRSGPPAGPPCLVPTPGSRPSV